MKHLLFALTSHTPASFSEASSGSRWKVIAIRIFTQYMAIKFEPIAGGTHSTFCTTTNDIHTDAFAYGALTLHVCNKVITWSQALNWLPWKPHFRIIRDNLIRISIQFRHHQQQQHTPPSSKYPIDCIFYRTEARKTVLLNYIFIWKILNQLIFHA